MYQSLEIIATVIRHLFIPFLLSEDFKEKIPMTLCSHGPCVSYSDWIKILLLLGRCTKENETGSHLVYWQTRSGNFLLPPQCKCRHLCIAQCNTFFSSAWQNHRQARHNTIEYIPSCYPRVSLGAACLRSSRREASRCRRTFLERRNVLWPARRTWVVLRFSGMEGTSHLVLLWLVAAVRLVVLLLDAL